MPFNESAQTLAAHMQKRGAYHHYLSTYYRTFDNRVDSIAHQRVSAEFYDMARYYMEVN